MSLTETGQKGGRQPTDTTEPIVTHHSYNTHIPHKPLADASCYQTVRQHKEKKNSSLFHHFLSLTATSSYKYAEVYGV